MIRIVRCVALILLVACWGCATTGAVYSSSTTVVPGTEDGQYEVVIKLLDLSGKAPKVIGTPKKLIVYTGGEEGKAAERDKDRMIIYSAIAEEAGGGTEIKAKVRVEDNGQPAWENEEKKKLSR